MKTIHIAIAFDKTYLTPFYVLLTSIFENNINQDFAIYVINNDLNKEEKETIEYFVVQHHSTITFYNVDQNNLHGFVTPKNAHYTIAAYFRLFFPMLVPSDLDKLIYIDTDTVVVGDLSLLYNMEIGDMPVAAVIDAGTRKPRLDLGMSRKDDYFNSGVLLINLPQWRKEKISERAIQFIHDYPEKIVFVDQDALNVVLAGNWFRLDYKFNVTFHNIPKRLPRRKYKSFLKDKIIIHYTIWHKPWLILNRNRLRFLYFNYFKRSPRSFDKKYTDFKPTLPIMIGFLKIRAIEFLYNFYEVLEIFKIGD